MLIFIAIYGRVEGTGRSDYLLDIVIILTE